MIALTEQRLGELHPLLQARGVRLAEKCSASAFGGFELFISEGLRAWEKQAQYFAEGRTTPSPAACVHDGVARPVGTCIGHPLGATVTNAPPGYSWHQFGLAFDGEPDDTAKPGFQPDWNLAHPAWQQLLALGKECGLAEGHDWHHQDNPHFQLPELPVTPPDVVRALYRSVGIAAVWAWADKLLDAAAPATAGS